MSALQAGPSSTTPYSILNLLTSLPITHPTFSSLLTAHTPFVRPSSLPSSQLSKLINRINAATLARDNEYERKSALSIAKEIVQMDEEGYVVMNWGKNWITTCLNILTVNLPLSPYSLPTLELLSTIIVSASQYPSFEREAVHPVLGKVAVTLSKLLDRCVSESSSLDISALVGVVATTKTILEHSPTPFRPLSPAMRPLLTAIILNIPPPPPSTPSTSTAPIPLDAPVGVRQIAADLLASLHLTSGKAQSPTAWATAMRDALGGISVAMTGLTKDGWEEEAVKVSPPAGPAGLPALPAEPGLRLIACLDWLEGFAEEVLALLRYPTSRPVPVPVAQIVSAGLRCLNLTLDTPTVSYISPQQHAALLAALPRIWTVGLLLIGSLVTTVGDHLLSHLSSILDHTTWLSERLPSSVTQTHLQLLHFQHLLFSLHPPALCPTEYPSRLLRHCLAQYSVLLESRSSPGGLIVNGGGSKRGKKRARGAEDGLIGGLEGRKQKAVSDDTIQVVLASMRLAALLHPTPLLAPSLLSFSIRLHLSIYLQTSTLASDAFSSLSHPALILEAIGDVLEQALLHNEGESGTGRGWKSAILSVLGSRGEQLSLLLHPSLPPMNRPQPPLNALHFFAKETEEEKKLRLKLGYRAGGDALAEDGMEVDETETEESRAGGRNGYGLAPPTPSVFARTKAVEVLEPSVRPDVIPVVSSSRTEKTVTTVVSTDTRAVVNDPTTHSLCSAVPQMPVAATEPTAIQAAPEPTAPFMSELGASSEGKEKVVEEVQVIKEVSLSMEVDDEDGPLPELDSGSSDEEGDDSDEEEEEEQEEVEGEEVEE